MPQEKRDTPADATRQDDYMRGGKGRKDEIGKSGIYPSSSRDAPPDAEIRSEAALARHEGPRGDRTDEQDSKTDGRSAESD